MNAAGQFFAHLNLGSQRAPSWNVWNKLNRGNPSIDGLGGIFLYDRFERFQGFTNAISGTTALPSTTIPSVDGYKVYVDSTTSASGIAKRTDEVGNIARFSPGGTDNHLAILHTGDMLKVGTASGVSALTIFEARLALPTQVASGSTFTGLASVGACADGGLIADAGGLKADQSGIGFRTKEDDADGIDFVVQKASQSEVVISNALQAATAGTFYKLGFVYDPDGPPAKKITIFLNGVDIGTYVTSTQMAAATFPNGDLVGMMAAAMTQATTARLLDLDWWACYQAYTS